MTKRLLLIVAVLAGCAFAPQHFFHRAHRTISPGNAGVMTSANVSLAGCFRTPDLSTAGGKTSIYPMTFRTISGTRYWFVVEQGPNLKRFPEPTLTTPANCGTDTSTYNVGVVDKNYGALTFGSPTVSDQKPGGDSNDYIFGLYWDETLSTIVVTWIPTYAAQYFHDSIARFTLNDTTPSATLFGCYEPDSTIPMPLFGGGILQIPSAFVSSNLPAGARWGGYGQPYACGQGCGMVEGPSIHAFVPPNTSNACASGTDHPLAGATRLMSYGVNSNGPTCVNVSMGCMPALTPTLPYPAQSSFTAYSSNTYPDIWEPYGGHGWWSYQASGALGWYDDGVKAAILAPFEIQAGWLVTTVSAGATPTATSARLSATDTHDGYHINPTDLFWINTCVTGVDTGCDSAQGHDMSFVVADTVNTGTGDITFHVILSDNCATCAHLPQVGGRVEFGSQYYEGEPQITRGRYRLQFYNPTTVANNIGASLNTLSQITALDEMDLCATVKGNGCPEYGGGVLQRQNGSRPPSAAMAVDPAQQQFMIAIPKCFYNGNDASCVYVFNVSHTP